jgi:hypothetical protein
MAHSIVGKVSRRPSSQRLVDPAARPLDGPAEDIPATTPAPEQQASEPETIPVVEAPPVPEFISQPSTPPEPQPALGSQAKLIDTWTDGAGFVTLIRGYQVPGNGDIVLLTHETRQGGPGKTTVAASHTCMLCGFRLAQTEESKRRNRWVIEQA